MKNIVITGHAGFIGTHLNRVLEIMNSMDREPRMVHYFDLKNGHDILDESLPKADFIFHLAAQTSVQDSVEDPMRDAETNIIGTIKILRENPQAKIIMTGSAAAKNPSSPYGISKLSQELYAQIIHKNTVICRLPNVFGEDDNGVIGKFLKLPVCRINGDGLQRRDFVHVDDIALGLAKAMIWNPGVYEFGSGRSVSILDIAKATGKPIEFAPALKDEIRVSVCQNTTPDWKPKMEVINFIKNYKK